MIMPWKYIIISLFIVGVILFSTLPVFAKPVTLGLFDKDEYSYDDAKVYYHDNERFVWIGTKAKKYNFTNDKEYAGAVGRFAIDCSGHTSALMEGFTFDKKGKEIQHSTVPYDKWVYISIESQTPLDKLYRILCVEHPIS